MAVRADCAMSAVGIRRGRAAGDHDGRAIVSPTPGAGGGLPFLSLPQSSVHGRQQAHRAGDVSGVLSENGLLPDEELDADAWEQLTLDVAAGRLDREANHGAAEETAAEAQMSQPPRAPPSHRAVTHRKSTATPLRQ